MTTTINIVLLGIGNVGSTLIKQLQEAENQIFIKHNIRIKIPVITNSQRAFFQHEGITSTWKAEFDKFSVPYSVQDIIEYVQEKNLTHLIAVDATASDELVKCYIPLIQNGFHIVSANKVANTLDSQFYANLRGELQKYQRKFLYETNVGAGLPVIYTLMNLHQAGERIYKIRGVFSGSLSYVFNSYSATPMPFSKVLRQAAELGLTEPDARDDLSGKDVARKLLILARELDLIKELDQVYIQSLVPKKLNGKTTLSQFNQRLKELDTPFEKLKSKLQPGEVLRYIGQLCTQTETLEVKLVVEDKTSPIGQLQGADSVFEIYTESYGDLPLVIRGAGAGKEVTARGVFSDILRVASSIQPQVLVD